MRDERIFYCRDTRWYTENKRRIWNLGLFSEFEVSVVRMWQVSEFGKVRKRWGSWVREVPVAVQREHAEEKGGQSLKDFVYVHSPESFTDEYERTDGGVVWEEGRVGGRIVIDLVFGPVGGRVGLVRARVGVARGGGRKARRVGTLGFQFSVGVVRILVNGHQLGFFWFEVGKWSWDGFLSYLVSKCMKVRVVSLVAYEILCMSGLLGAVSVGCVLVVVDFRRYRK